MSQTPVFKSWSGYAYESLCLKHTEQIKKALEIGGIYAEVSSFFFKGNEALPGTQIDLIIDRNDQVINLCEIKFQQTEFNITKSYAEQLRKKVFVFREVSKTRKQLFLTMISTFGTNENKHSLGLIDHDLKMDLFFS